MSSSSVNCPIKPPTPPRCLNVWGSANVWTTTLRNFPAVSSSAWPSRALVKRPYLLLGDEPTGNLDYETGLLVLQLIRDINREDGLTVLMVTHNAAIGAMADVVLRMHSGQLDSIETNDSPIEPHELKW